MKKLKTLSLTFLFIVIIIILGCSSNKTGTFSEPYVKNTSFQADYVSGFAVHPTNPEIMFMSFNNKEVGGLFKSIDGGKTWTNVLKMLGKILVFDPLNPNYAYFAEFG